MVGDLLLMVGADIEVDWSECRYTVPLVDSGGRTRWLKARGVEYTVYTGPTVVPPNASTVFPEMGKILHHTKETFNSIPSCNSRVVLKWIPPTGFVGNVAFVATVVEKFTSYWVGIQVLQML